MKKLIFLHALFAAFGVNAQPSLHGIVKNKTSSEPIPGAVIYSPDFKNGTLSKVDGTFELFHLPPIKTLLQVKLIGYKTLVRVVDVSLTNDVVFELEESVIEENEVVITGVSKATEIKKSPVPMTLIDSKYLEQNSASNIIDAISKVPGVNALSTGPNVSKPLIRGLGGSRVVTLFDGVRQEGQQWGEEHGVEVDQYLIDRVEVVKGPASLIYGSDALAGVVNLLPAIPQPEGRLKGNFLSEYQSNNGSRSASGAIAGNKRGFLFSARGSYKEAGNYMNSIDGKVYHTGFNERDLYAMLGLNRKWGYSHLTFLMYDNSQEIPDGSRDSATRKFTRQVSEADTLRPIVSPAELRSYTIDDIHQRIGHYRVFSTSNFILGQKKLAIRLGYQRSIRREYSHPQMTAVPGLYLDMHTGTYDLKFYFAEKKGWESALGLNGMYQFNNASRGTEFVIPSYSLFDVAPFVYAKKNIGRWDLAAGARLDTRTLRSDVLFVKSDPLSGLDRAVNDSTGAAKRFLALRGSFAGFSASFGMTFNINDKFLIKGNLSRGFRAPNISELSAAGVHPGTGYMQMGNQKFKPEFNLQEDLGAFFESEHVSTSAEIFSNLITNYIFNQKLASAISGDSIYSESGNAYPVYKLRQTKALLYGGEARIDVHPNPLDWLHFENSISLVLAKNLGGNGVTINSANKYLPMIPPLHTNSEVRAEFRKKLGRLSNIFVKAGLEWYAAQQRVVLADNTETKTPGYILFDAAFGAHVNNKKDRTLFSVGIFGTNLADAAYQSNMSRLKYFEQYPNNNTGRSGIYNMGRNVTVKVTVPLDGRISKK